MCEKTRICRCELHDELIQEEERRNPDFKKPAVKKAWLKKFYNKGTRYSVMGVCELCEEFVSERLMPIREAVRIRDNAKPAEAPKTRPRSADFSAFEDAVADFLSELDGGESPLAPNDTGTCSFRDCHKEMLRITYRHGEDLPLCGFHATASEEARSRAKHRGVADTAKLATHHHHDDPARTNEVRGLET